MDSSFGDNSVNHLNYGSFSTENCSFSHGTSPKFGASSAGTAPPSIDRPAVQLKLSPAGSSSQIVSFRNPASPLLDPFYGANCVGSTVWEKEAVSSEGKVDFTAHLISQGKPNQIGDDMEAISGQGSYSIRRSHSAINRLPLNAKDHVMAERKRRERLSEHFIALCALIPGLKKMDKASVLEDAAKYVKQLQECVKKLEEEVARKPVESVVLVKKFKVEGDGDSSSSDVNSCKQSEHQLPEIEARVSEKLVLIRIQFERQEGVISKILNLIEKLSFSVLSTSVIPFGSSILDITIVAQMDDEFSMTVTDLVRNLHESLLNLV